MNTPAGTLARHAGAAEDPRLEEIFRDFHQPLYRYCLAIVGNRSDAEDALQNTMLKVLRALPGEQRSIALKPWLYRIAHNESIDLLRRRRGDTAAGETEQAGGEDLAVKVETRERLRQLLVDLGSLPDRQRETLLMREAGGLSFDEIGAALETSPAVARQTLYEARLGLREMDVGREMECGTVTEALSAGDGRVRRRRDIRAHLRGCPECRRFAEEIDTRREALAAIAPLPAVAAAALLKGLIGGGGAGGAAVASGASSGAGLAGGAAGAGSGAGIAGGAAGAGSGVGLAGGAAIKSIGAATLWKGAATIAAVAVIGVGAADRGGLIDLGGGADKTTPGGAAPERPSDRNPGERVGSDTSADSASTSGVGAGSEAAGKSNLGDSRAISEPDPAVESAPTPIEPDPGSGPAEPDSQEAVTEGAAGVESAPGKSGVDHPSGRGHAKETPAAASHGQETAASHKAEPTPGYPSGKPEPASQSGGNAEGPKSSGKPGAPAPDPGPGIGAEANSESPSGKPPK